LRVGAIYYFKRNKHSDSGEILDYLAREKRRGIAMMSNPSLQDFHEIMRRTRDKY